MIVIISLSILFLEKPLGRENTRIFKIFYYNYYYFVNKLFIMIVVIYYCQFVFRGPLGRILFIVISVTLLK